MNERGKKIGRRLRADRAGAANGCGFLASTARTLREACCEAGLDQNGRRCRDCPVGDLCADDSRWLVRRARNVH
jgi:hypothetical protein